LSSLNQSGLPELFEDRQHAVAELCAECARFSTPEQINHGPDSHPRNELKNTSTTTMKNVHGPLLAYGIGFLCCVNDVPTSADG